MYYDTVVIGAGHNGLVAAAYLARAGQSVCVLERRAVLGGCCSTEELWPGFLVSPAAYVVSLFLPEIIAELELEEAGLEILPRDPSSFTPLPDDAGLVLGRDPALNRREISRFSDADAEAYPEYERFLGRVAETLEPLLTAPPPELPPSLPPAAADLSFWWRAFRALRRLDDDLPGAAELLTGAASRILERWFESEPLRATLATDAVIGAFQPPSAQGSAYVLLHHVMGEAGGARGVWGYVRGGMGGLAEALATRCEGLGVEIRREAPVESIGVLSDPGTEVAQVAGVTLEDGTFVAADRVVSSLDAARTALELLGAEHLPDAYRRRVESVDYASASLKMNLALDGLPAFDTGQRPRRPTLAGTIHVSPDLVYIERAYEDAKWGQPSREPVLEVTIPSVVDPTLAPEGKHVMQLFVQYAPYRLEDEAEAAEAPAPEHGWTEARRDAFGDRCLEVLEAYAPGVTDLVLHRQILAPPDLERIYGLTGGNIFQGAMTLDQLGPLRTPYRTPVEGLWMCGAATPPGGGVMGACGRNAARQILRSR